VTSLIALKKSKHSFLKISNKSKFGNISNFESAVNISPKIIKEKFLKKLYNSSDYRFEVSNTSNRKRTLGLICGGVWDIGMSKVSRSTVNIDFKNVFIYGKSWENTNIHNLTNLKLKRDGTARGNSKSWNEFKKTKIKEWENLYKQIKANGYSNHVDLNKPSSSEVEVGITRKGKVALIDGKHRLAIAQILELDEIPVIINLVHKKYYDKLLKTASKEEITPQYIIDSIIKNNNS
jgi:hypothetical protein